MPTVLQQQSVTDEEGYVTLGDVSLTEQAGYTTLHVPVFGSPIVTPVGDPLTQHRAGTTFGYTLIELSGTRSDLTGVQVGGGLDWAAGRTVKGKGSLAVEDVGQGYDRSVWASCRIAVDMTVTPADGGDPVSWPLGVWIPTVPGDDWTSQRHTWPLELLDISHTLRSGGISAAISCPTGTVVTDKVRDLIEDAGLTASVTDSSKQLRGPLAWPAGTPRITVINDLLATIDYRSVYADGDGVIRVEPYLSPSQRPYAWTFTDDNARIYTPTVGRRQDLASIPTEVILRTQDGALTGYYAPPASSPWAAENRNTPVTLADTVEATDQATIDALAYRRWVDASTPQATVDIEHLPVPSLIDGGPLLTSDAVHMMMTAGGLDDRHVIQSTGLTLSPTALARSTLQETIS